MQNNNNLTQKFKATLRQIEEMIEFYDGYTAYNASPYIITRVKLQDTTITFYKTNVVLFQGEGASREYNYWAEKYHLDKVEVEVQEFEKFQKLSCIGTDEVGTGDFFGPITVCAAYVPKDMISELNHLGVKDSKLLTDDQILNIGYQLIKMIPYSVMKLEPSKLNNLNAEQSNFNFIKAYLHNKAILSILKKLENVKYDAIVIDEFTPKAKYFEYLKKQPEICTDVNLVQKGERASIAVAAASIIARLAFLKELQALSQKYSQVIPKGAGPETEKVAISFIKSNDWNEFKQVAKLKFQNTDRILQYFKENPLPKEKQGTIPITK